MKKNFLTLSIIASIFSYAQNQNAIEGRMGINTTSPRATLDIVAEDSDTNPGVIVPNITDENNPYLKEEIKPNTKDKVVRIFNKFKKLEKVVGDETKDFAESTLIYLKGVKEPKEEDCTKKEPKDCTKYTPEEKQRLLKNWMQFDDNKRIDVKPTSKTEEVSHNGFYYYDGKDWLPLRPKTQMYLPSIVLETELPPKKGTKPYTSAEADKIEYCVNLYNVYQGQFKNITNDNKTATSSNNRLNDGCRGATVTDATKTISIENKTYKASTESRKLEILESGNDFDYYVTYYDPDIFKDVKIENRTLRYKIKRNQTDPTKTENNITEKTFISILLREH